MEINKKVILILAGVFVMGTIIYFGFIRKNPYAILGEKAYGNLGKDYVSARAKAFQKKKETFEVNGKSYLTETGKAV